MQPLTLFSWGYWGWGNSTPQLVQAVDAVEAARGFAPPLFVDIRISRSVRAPGFNGHAFEETIGSSRYRWMPELGNLAVTDGGDEGIRIKDPTAAETLLDIAVGAAESNRRVVFFCACEFPGVDGEEGCCHRTRVAGLVLEAAQRRGLSVRVAEWPGSELSDRSLELELDEPVYSKVLRGSVSIPLSQPVNLVEVAGLAWGTPAKVQRKGYGEDGSFRVLTGPARFVRSGWQLPLLEDVDVEATFDDVLAQAREYQESRGYAARQIAAPSIGISGGEKASPKDVRKSDDAEPEGLRRRSRRSQRSQFMRPLTPSGPLAQIIGSEPQARTEITSRLWDYIQSHGLQDEEHRRRINCDEKFRALTGKDYVTMFELTKYVSEHLS